MTVPGPGKTCANCANEIEEDYVVYETRTPNTGSQTYFCSDECLAAWLSER